MTQFKIYDLADFVDETPSIIDFLATHQLKYEAVDQTIFMKNHGQIIATASRLKNTIKCVAIAANYQGNNLLPHLLTKLFHEIYAAGFDQIFIFSKPATYQFLQPLNFVPLYQDQTAVFLTNRYDLYKKLRDKLSTYQLDEAKPMRIGAVVMNANPLSLGHEFLIKQALNEVDFLYVILVEEDLSFFSFKDRWQIVSNFTDKFKQIKLLPSSNYIVSATVFSGYFIEEKAAVVELQTRIDTKLFYEIFCQTLNIKVRFLGEEPYSQSTNIYNQVIQTTLPNWGVQVKIIPRLKNQANQIISATSIRHGLMHKQYDLVKLNVSQATWTYLKNKFQF